MTTFSIIGWCLAATLAWRLLDVIILVRYNRIDREDAWQLYAWPILLPLVAAEDFFHFLTRKRGKQ